MTLKLTRAVISWSVFHRPAPSRILGIALSLAVVCSACADRNTLDSATSAERDGSSSNSALDWKACENEDPMLDLSGVECATLQVPVDHSEPDGPTIELALGRIPAFGGGDGAEGFVGSLLTNPGGPGASGIDSLAGLSRTLPEEVLDAFDVVSWDPRGISRSAPVRCLSDERNDAQIEGDLSPDTVEELDHAVALSAEFRDACEANNSELIEHMSTADVAEDLEQIRVALGEERLNYLGFSYGTAIGATYATLFGENIRAMVLDGAVSPTVDDSEATVEQTQGFEQAYHTFLEACATDSECPLDADPKNQVEALRKRLDSEPIQTSTMSGPRTMGRDLFDVGMATALYDTATWGMLARAIDTIDDGGAEVMLALSDLQFGRKPDGSWDSSSDAQAMVGCADTDERPDLDTALAEYEEILPELAEASPTFGETLAVTSIGCVDWPLAANPVPEIEAPDAPPIMVVGTFGDPATPYEWSEEMTDALASAFLVTYEGEGHTATTRGGECMAAILTNYLLEPASMDDPSCPPVQETDEGDTPPFASNEEVLFDELVAQGAPTGVARCVAEGVVDHYGEARIDLSLLQPDVEDQIEVVTGLTMKCMTGG